MRKPPKILIAPLDWGLGHLTRCIPIVNELLKQGWEVWIASDLKGIALMRQEFPQVSTLNIEGYNVFYHPSKKGFVWKIIGQVPRLIGRIRGENRWLKEVLQQHKFDVVISDNRFGLYNASVYCIFITHQLHIKTGINKWANSLLRRINYRYINQFNECWIPDFKGERNISGDLSHGGVLPANIKYMGILSRFEKMPAHKKYDLLIMLSGPEPSRTNWENKLLQQLPFYKGKVCLVRGLPEVETQITSSENIEIINHLSAKALSMAIQQSEWVICRSGYTSVMDLVKLQHKAILVATPGQPEQEYLATYLKQKKIFYSERESEFSILHSIEQAKHFPFDFDGFSEDVMSYKQIIENLTCKISSAKKEPMPL